MKKRSKEELLRNSLASIDYCISERWVWDQKSGPTAEIEASLGTNISLLLEPDSPLIPVARTLGFTEAELHSFIDFQHRNLSPSDFAAITEISQLGQVSEMTIGIFVDDCGIHTYLHSDEQYRLVPIPQRSFASSSFWNLIEETPEVTYLSRVFSFSLDSDFELYSDRRCLARDNSWWEWR